MQNQQLFTGQVAIVTGAGQGIGYEISRQLVLQGCRVVLNDLYPDLTHSAVEKINQENVLLYPVQDCQPCQALPGDASDISFIQQMVSQAVASFGRLDIVIANAGITLFGDFLSYPPDSFYKVMQLNLAGSFFLAQAAARQMKDQGEGGSILFTSSVTGHQAHRQLAAYGMSKAALEMLARNLVIELSPFHITVNTIAPGATLTERTAGDTAYEKTWSSLTPLGRPAIPADIAQAAVFLVSSLARHITGQSLIIDGGWTAVSPGPF
jgi:glucose 1-dehydrogenase